MVSLLVIGDSHDAPLEPIGRLAAVRARFVPDLTAAVALVASPGADFVPDLVLLAESRPGEIRRSTMHALRRQAPLVRVWRVVGSWCDGEARSGHPPAAGLTVAEHDLLPRLARELARLARGEQPLWALPLTATPEEQLLATIDADFRRPASAAIAIHGTSAAGVSSLVDLCRRAGHTPVDWPAKVGGIASPPAAILWDTTAPR